MGALSALARDLTCKDETRFQGIATPFRTSLREFVGGVDLQGRDPFSGDGDGEKGRAMKPTG